MIRKVMIFNNLYAPYIIGGAEKSTQILAEGLLKCGLEVSVVTTCNKDYTDIVNGVKVYYVRVPNLYWVYECKRQSKLKKPFWHLIDSYNPFTGKIADILNKENPDIVHTNNLAGFSVSVWKLIKSRNIPIVHTLRDYYLLCPRAIMFNEKTLKNCEKQCLVCKFYSFPKKLLSNKVDAVVGVSKFILNKHLNFGYFKNALIKTYIYNPIVKRNNLPLNKNKSSKIRLGFVGLLSKQKGIEFLLEKFVNLNMENIELHIYGRGITPEYEKFLKDKFSKYPNIFFHGFKKDEKEIYKNIDILITPSLFNEPCARVVIEAMSYKIPVLASNKGSMSELIVPGKNGYIFDLEKSKDFRHKLVKLIELLKKDNICFDLRNFDVNFVIKKYLEIYNKVIS
ncbi:MAG TPA: glycosyltransferase [Aquificae bacterium]|nr:glycosyltransferase [Aquificota bacterium]